MSETEMAEKIIVSELGSTWGCVWEDNDGVVHYGFDDCPKLNHRAKLWLACAQGDAVRLLLEAGIATVVRSWRGGYGGEERTVEVDVAKLEASCDRYWDRLNAAAVQQDETSCHYCGQQASGTGFFGESVCREC